MTEGGVSPLPREARPYQGQRAGIVSRLVAAVIDGIVVALVLLLGYLAWAGLLFILDPLKFSFPDTSLLLSVAAGLVVLVVYLTGSWWASGRTYGCLVMGLRVVSFRGQKLSPFGAFVRALLCAFFPIGIFWIAVSRKNRSVQDVALRTSVVYDWQPKGASRQRRP